MNRRKFTIGIGSLAAGSAAAIGTGAFTSVEADRGVEIDVVGDAKAFVSLDGDGEYVSEVEGEDTLEVDVDDEADPETVDPGNSTSISVTVDSSDDAVDGDPSEDTLSVELSVFEPSVYPDYPEDNGDDDPIVGQ